MGSRAGETGPTTLWSPGEPGSTHCSLVDTYSVHELILHTSPDSSQQMSPLRVWLKSLFQRPPWPVIVFPNNGFDIIEEPSVEEEESEGFPSGDYYPMVIGDVLNSRYQVVGKLGFGVSSTVWLARDMRWVCLWCHSLSFMLIDQGSSLRCFKSLHSRWR